LCVPDESPGRPDWDHLFETAVAQGGLFTTKQAAEAGYSPQLLAHYLRIGRVVRVQRGIYRLVHFPAGEHEELVAAWLWSEQAGLFSHQTALSLHELSDVLPSQVHLTVPGEWQHRRLRVPAGITLHLADVPDEDRSWFGVVPLTSPRRTLIDCATAQLSPQLLSQAARQALRRGLVTRAELGPVLRALDPFGDLPP
jgi:predicted transcriptional regulator of viral defense system